MPASLAAFSLVCVFFVKTPRQERIDLAVRSWFRCPRRGFLEVAARHHNLRSWRITT